MTEGGGGTSTLLFGLDAGIGNVVVADDATSQAAIGIRERVYDYADITTDTAASAQAAALLSIALSSTNIVTYRTRTAGLLPGQAQTISVSSRGVSGSHIILQVNARQMRDRAAGLMYEVQARAGTVASELWRDVYRQWFGSSTSSSSSGGGFAGGAVIGGTVSSGPAPSYFLGGNPTVWVQSASPTWVPADGSPSGDSGTEVVLDPATRGTSSATVRVRLRARSGSVTARLWDLDASAAVGTSSAYTGTTFGTVTFPVALTTGLHRYQLQLLPGSANVDVNGMGTLY